MALRQRYSSGFLLVFVSSALDNDMSLSLGKGCTFAFLNSVGSKLVCNSGPSNQNLHKMTEGFNRLIQPFPTYNKSAADDFKYISAKKWKRSINEK